MSIDKSLKGKNTLERHRNVLTRAERIEKLKELGQWTENSKVLGMAKFGHRKVSVGKKTKEKKDGDADATESTTAADGGDKS